MTEQLDFFQKCVWQLIQVSKLASYPDQYRWGLGTRLTTARGSILKNKATIALPRHDRENLKNTLLLFVLVLIVVLHSVSLRKLSLSQDLHWINYLLKNVFFLTWHCNEDFALSGSCSKQKWKYIFNGFGFSHNAVGTTLVVEVRYNGKFWWLF